jgi:hypothetical protein
MNSTFGEEKRYQHIIIMTLMEIPHAVLLRMREIPYITVMYSA